MAIVEINWERSPITGEVVFDSNGYPVAVPDPTANTFQDLYTRVQYETLGPATLSDAQAAVLDAVGEFESEVFWFSDARYFGGYVGSAGNLQTQIGKEFYSYQDLPMLTNVPHIKQIVVFAFGNRYELTKRTQQWMDLQSMNPNWMGLPTDWCYVGNAIRLYPIPNQVYSMIIEGTIRFPPLANDTDYSPWTNRAERLIRAEAKRLLFININRDQPQAQLMELDIYGDPRTGRQGYLAQLRRETARRMGTPSKLKPARGYMS